MSPKMRDTTYARVSFPRVSGDEPPNAYGADYVRELSPREWG